MPKFSPSVANSANIGRIALVATARRLINCNPLGTFLQSRPNLVEQNGDLYRRITGSVCLSGWRSGFKSNYLIPPASKMPVSILVRPCITAYAFSTPLTPKDDRSPGLSWAIKTDVADLCPLFEGRYRWGVCRHFVSRVSPWYLDRRSETRACSMYRDSG
jgi:hypothetical protein